MAMRPGKQVCWADRVPGSDSTLRTGSSPRAARQAVTLRQAGLSRRAQRDFRSRDARLPGPDESPSQEAGRAHDLIPPLLGASLRAGAQAGRS